MTFSLVTVCFNSAATIGRTLDSVLSQDFEAYEYLIIDGASTDGTLDIVRCYEAKFGGRMRVVSEPDRGIYDAMNKALKLARGEWVGFINSDDWYVPGALRGAAEAAEAAPGAAVLYGLVRTIDEAGDEIELVRRHHSHLEEETICHQACFFRRATALEYNGFNLKYRICADFDLLLRLKLGGVEFHPFDRQVAAFQFGGVSTRDTIARGIQNFQVLKDNGVITEGERRKLELKLKLKRLYLKFAGLK